MASLFTIGVQHMVLVILGFAYISILAVLIVEVREKCGRPIPLKVQGGRSPARCDTLERAGGLQ